jgi:hypothetical protein
LYLYLYLYFTLFRSTESEKDMNRCGNTAMDGDAEADDRPRLRVRAPTPGAGASGTSKRRDTVTDRCAGRSATESPSMHTASAVNVKVATKAGGAGALGACDHRRGCAAAVVAGGGSKPRVAFIT